MKKTAIALIGFVFFSVSLMAQSSAKTKINASISGVPANVSKVYLMEYSRTQTILDSAVVDAEGAFSFALDLPEASYFYMLSFDPEHGLPMILFSGDKLHIQGSYDNMIENVNVEGSKETQLLLAGVRATKTVDEEIEDWSAKYRAARKAKDDVQAEELEKAYAELTAQKEAIVKSFINENTQSLACLMFIGTLSMDDHLEVYQKLDEALYPKYKDMEYMASIHQKVINAAKLVIGAVAPEIELPTPEGEMVKLSSLRGQYVLIDFWASWCGPCRQENPNVVRLYNEYKEKGFEVYSVSLDRSKADWEKAINADGLDWTHVSDLKFWNSQAAKDYNISSIPKTYLLDKEGKIIAKGLRGEELEAKLKALLGE